MMLAGSQYTETASEAWSQKHAAQLGHYSIQCHNYNTVGVKFG